MSVLVVIDLQSQASFDFQYFPERIRSGRHVNWRPQDVTIGTKPLLYEGREPKRLHFEEVWLDNTESGQSLTPILDELEEFCTSEQDISGSSRRSAPPLLVTWGDRKLRCVMEDIDIEENYFNSSGEPTRARLTMDFIEIQEEAEAAYTI